jgi:DNA helicase-2/ATP-dependent DNA helicase PcrA
MGIEARYAFEFDAVIPGRVKDANPESRDSGLVLAHHPGMTADCFVASAPPRSDGIP